MDKRGLSHIEIILSFILFIGAIIFAIYFFSPPSSDNLAGSSLNYVTREIVSNVEANLMTYSLTVNSPGILILSVPVSPGFYSKAENYIGNKVNSTIDYANNKVYVNGNNDQFIKLKISNGFNFSPDTLPSSSTGNYTISSSDSEKIISENFLIRLAENYSSNYLALKGTLNLPASVDFDFGLMMGGENITVKRDIPNGVNVFSNSQRVQVLRPNGELTFGDLIIRIW